MLIERVMTHFLYIRVDLFTIGSPAYGYSSCQYSCSFEPIFTFERYVVIDVDDVMFSAVSIILLVWFHSIKLFSACQSDAMLWTYYPCSFIISPTSFDCDDLLVTASIDQCVNKEMTFFWHFPFGNMTLTLQTDNNQPFLLHLSQISLSTNKLIKNTYHLVNKSTSEERLISNDKNDLITLHSNKLNQCSVKFETVNSNIYDYGTFLRIAVSNDETRNL